MPAPEPILVAGRWRPARAVATFQAVDPATATPREAVWPVSTWADCDEALDAAVAAAAELARLPADRIAAFLERFAAQPEANGCAGLPRGGRSEAAFQAKLKNNHEMAGNLYAVRGTCIAAFRAKGVRLPFGMFGEDGLVATLIKYDLDTKGTINHARITACDTAFFDYESLSPWNLRDLRIYRNRRMRYAVRRQQANMIYPLLYEQGVEAMPAHVIDLYRARHALMEFGWNGLDTYFDWIAHKRIRRDIAADDRAKLDERAHLYS